MSSVGWDHATFEDAKTTAYEASRYCATSIPEVSVDGAISD